MDDSVTGTWRGRTGGAYSVELEVEFRHDGTYRATALQPTGPETTHGRYRVVAGTATTIEFAYTSSGDGPPLTERLTMRRDGDRLLLQDQVEEMVLTKRPTALTDTE